MPRNRSEAPLTYRQLISGVLAIAFFMSSCYLLEQPSAVNSTESTDPDSSENSPADDLTFEYGYRKGLDAGLPISGPSITFNLQGQSDSLLPTLSFARLQDSAGHSYLITQTTEPKVNPLIYCNGSPWSSTEDERPTALQTMPEDDVTACLAQGQSQVITYYDQVTQQELQIPVYRQPNQYLAYLNDNNQVVFGSTILTIEEYQQMFTDLYVKNGMGEVNVVGGTAPPIPESILTHFRPPATPTPEPSPTATPSMIAVIQNDGTGIMQPVEEVGKLALGIDPWVDKIYAECSKDIRAWEILPIDSELAPERENFYRVINEQTSTPSEILQAAQKLRDETEGAHPIFNFFHSKTSRKVGQVVPVTLQPGTIYRVEEWSQAKSSNGVVILSDGVHKYLVIDSDNTLASIAYTAYMTDSTTLMTSPEPRVSKVLEQATDPGNQMVVVCPTDYFSSIYSTASSTEVAQSLANSQADLAINPTGTLIINNVIYNDVTIPAGLSGEIESINPDGMVTIRVSIMDNQSALTSFTSRNFFAMLASSEYGNPIGSVRIVLNLGSVINKPGFLSRIQDAAVQDITPTPTR